MVPLNINLPITGSQHWSTLTDSGKTNYVTMGGQPTIGLTIKDCYLVKQ